VLALSLPLFVVQVYTLHVGAKAKPSGSNNTTTKRLHVIVIVIWLEIHSYPSNYHHLAIRSSILAPIRN